MNVKIQCESCTYILGTVDLDKLRTVKANDFGPPEPGFPEPFCIPGMPVPEYDWIRCPMCKRHPFQSKNRLMLENGEFISRVDGEWERPAGPPSPPVPIEETEEYARAWAGATPAPPKKTKEQTPETPPGSVVDADPTPPAEQKAKPLTVKEATLQHFAAGDDYEAIEKLLHESGHHDITADMIEAMIDEQIADWHTAGEKPAAIGVRLGKTPQWIGRRLKKAEQ